MGVIVDMMTTRNFYVVCMYFRPRDFIDMTDQAIASSRETGPRQLWVKISGKLWPRLTEPVAADAPTLTQAT